MADRWPHPRVAEVRRASGGVTRAAAATQVPDLTCAETDYTGQQIILGRACNKLSCIDLLRGKITGDVRAPPLPPPFLLTLPADASVAHASASLSAGCAAGVVVQMETSTGTTALCRNGMQIVCGGADGTIVLRDFRKCGPPSLPSCLYGTLCTSVHRLALVSLRSARSLCRPHRRRPDKRCAIDLALTRACVIELSGLRAEHTLPAHMSAVVAVDTHRDLLVSCGFTQRHGQVQTPNE
jgi:hypothetical protein